MTLLVEAPVGRHFAQFHRHGNDLFDAVHTFLDAGLRRDQSVLVIAAPEQLDGLLDGLTRSKFHVKALTNSGQLSVVDATQLVEQCTPNGLPNWTRFRGALLPMLTRLEPFGRGTRVYSGMSGVLWQEGNVDAAIRVEEMWNTLAVSIPFSLYCCYAMDTHSEQSYAGPLEEVGRTHSEILGTPDDERFGVALDRASKEIFGISLTQMAGVTRQDGARPFPTGQRTMLWVMRNLPMSTSQLVERARHYYQKQNGSQRPRA